MTDPSDEQGTWPFRFDSAFHNAGTAVFRDPRIPDTVSHLRECYAKGWIDLEQLELRLPKALEVEQDAEGDA